MTAPLLVSWRACAAAAAMAWLVSACGGADQSPAAPRIASAIDARCGAAEAMDNGRVLYLRLPSGCLDDGGRDVVLTVTFDGNPREQRVALPALDSAAVIEVWPGHVREVSAHRAGSWRRIANVGQWDWRDGAGLLQKDGGLYLLGGWNSETGTKSDVWFTANLSSWRLLGRAPWAARHGAGWVVHRDRLFVVGGDLVDDVWSSADGINWQQESARAPFGKRYTPNAASLNGRLFVFAGQYWAPYDWCAFAPACTAVGFGDVWSSEDGREWSRVQIQAPWSPRGLIHGAAIHRDRLWLLGGGLKVGQVGTTEAEAVDERDDVWSSADGVSWRLEAEHHGAAPRTHHAVLGTAHGRYIAGGSVGTQANTTHEVLFAADCLSFRALPDTEHMGTRHAASLVEFNRTIVLLGGHANTAGTAVWQYFPEGS